MTHKEAFSKLTEYMVNLKPGSINANDWSVLLGIRGHLARIADEKLTLDVAEKNTIEMAAQFIDRHGCLSSAALARDLRGFSKRHS